MAILKGDNGEIQTGGTAWDTGSQVVGEIKSWTVDQSADTIESSVMGDTAKTFVAGMTSWTASCEALLDGADAGQQTLDVGATVTLRLSTDGATETYAGSAIVTSISTSAAIGDMVSASISFQGTGALTADPYA